MLHRGHGRKGTHFCVLRSHTGVVITKHRRERARAPRPLWREEASMDVTDVHAHRTRLCKLTISHRTGPAEV